MSRFFPYPDYFWLVLHPGKIQYTVGEVLIALALTPSRCVLLFALAPLVLSWKAVSHFLLNIDLPDSVNRGSLQT